MNYISFHVIVKLESGEKMTFRITAKDIDSAKAHVRNYLAKKGKPINSMRCVTVKNTN